MQKNITANLGVSMTGVLLGDVNQTYTTYLDIAQQIKVPRMFSKAPLGGILLDFSSSLPPSWVSICSIMPTSKVVISK